MAGRLARERAARFARPTIRRPRVMRPREDRQGRERLRIERLRDLAAALLGSESTEAVAEAAVRRIRELLPCAHLSVVVFDHKGDTSLFANLRRAMNEAKVPWRAVNPEGEPIEDDKGETDRPRRASR